LYSLPFDRSSFFGICRKLDRNGGDTESPPIQLIC
jgi:hypothetical protein